MPIVSKLAQIQLPRCSRKYIPRSQTFSYMLTSHGAQYAEAAKNILLKRFHHKITIYKIAEEISVSESTLKRAFRNHYNVGIYEYQVQLRIEKAKELLQAGGKSIKYISLQVGYKRQSAFAKMFKKYAGVAPLMWSNMYKGESADV